MAKRTSADEMAKTLLGGSFQKEGSDPTGKEPLEARPRITKENKTKRVNLLIRETDYKAWKEKAEDMGMSLTQFIESKMNN